CSQYSCEPSRRPEKTVRVLDHRATRGNRQAYWCRAGVRVQFFRFYRVVVVANDLSQQTSSIRKEMPGGTRLEPGSALLERSRPVYDSTGPRIELSRIHVGSDARRKIMIQLTKDILT